MEQEHIGDYEHPVPLQDAVGDEAGRSRQLAREEPVLDALGGAAAPLFIDLGGNGEQEDEGRAPADEVGDVIGHDGRYEPVKARQANGVPMVDQAGSGHSRPAPRDGVGSFPGSPATPVGVFARALRELADPTKGACGIAASASLP